MSEGLCSYYVTIIKFLQFLIELTYNYVFNDIRVVLFVKDMFLYKCSYLLNTNRQFRVVFVDGRILYLIKCIIWTGYTNVG
jgi:hypothetical protein